MLVVIGNPIIYKNKRSTSEYGCDNLYTGDVVRVEGYDDDFKVTLDLCKNVFSLPMHTELTKVQQDFIINGVKDFIATKA